MKARGHTNKSLAILSGVSMRTIYNILKRRGKTQFGVRFKILLALNLPYQRHQAIFDEESA